MRESEAEGLFPEENPRDGMVGADGDRILKRGFRDILDQFFDPFPHL